MYEQDLCPALFIMPEQLWNIFHSHSLTGICRVIILEHRIRNFDITYKVIIDDDALGSVLARTLSLVNIDVVD
ncbi:hypothetical protein SDC9_109367 [bioreactor metagenome]|uniref:Uncharacterized protein n=1 Tax=bioreactor metagenome TaxID=1076179 RepID=A0A645BAK7_9ZZZZ